MEAQELGFQGFALLLTLPPLHAEHRGTPMGGCMVRAVKGKVTFELGFEVRPILRRTPGAEANAPCAEAEKLGRGSNQHPRKSSLNTYDFTPPASFTS